MYREQTRDASTGTYAPSTQFPGDTITVTLHNGTTYTGRVWYQGHELRFTTFRDLLLQMRDGATLRGAFTVHGITTIEGPAIRHIHKVV